MANTNIYCDSWSSATEIPKYKEYRDNKCKTKTSILVPFYVNSERMVLNIETAEALSFTNAISEEITLVARAISDIYIKNTIYKKDVKDTKDIVETLNILSIEEIQYGKIPLFVASSDRAENDVMGEIRSLLIDYSDFIKVFYWKSSTVSRDVRNEIHENLHQSRMGICYFSEPAEGEYSYHDNPNVIFEAGFLQASTYSRLGNSNAWIPIREPNSPATPFDLSGERLVVIERDKEGVLNKEAFRKVLQDRVEGILQVI